MARRGSTLESEANARMISLERKGAALISNGVDPLGETARLLLADPDLMPFV